MPPSGSAEREEERRLNTRTLTIASIASATAAAVTSQLWIAGTWIAAALTPVLVALISEAMHRPTERIAQAWTSERDARRSTSPAHSPTRREPAAVTGTPGPVRVYRQTPHGATEAEPGRLALAGRRIPVRGVAMTAAVAFVVAIAALTTIDLVSGGSVGKGSGRTTFFSGNKSRAGDSAKQQEQEATPQRQESPDEQQNTPSAPTTTAPAPEEPTPSDTAPVPPPSEAPPGEPEPNSTP
jgi:hypothetical protein